MLPDPWYWKQGCLFTVHTMRTLRKKIITNKAFVYQVEKERRAEFFRFHPPADTGISKEGDRCCQVTSFQLPGRTLHRSSGRRREPDDATPGEAVW
jgi:hypothetical protein